MENGRKKSNYLVLDTSGKHFTAIAVKNGAAHAVFLPDCAMKHSVSLLPAVEEALQKANLRLEECDFFAAVVGAGSFTGIRIGISAVKGFCLAFGKPALPVTSFDVAAYNTIDGAQGKTLCLVDALHDCYYACGYENGRAIYPPTYLTEAEALALQAQGYALAAFENLPISAKTDVRVIDPVEGLKNAVCALAEKGAFAPLSALYVRKSSAELNKEQA